jgi:dipeptidyl aminopeptidase/acylaminoacyl peptidase
VKARVFLPFVMLLALSLSACGPRKGTPQPITPSPRIAEAQLPPLGPKNSFVSGVLECEQRLPSSRGEGLVRVYLPNPMPPGKVPCVFVAPAGSPLIYGMALGAHGEGDGKEHYPYALAGFIVVAYSIDGHVNNNKDDAEIVAGIKAFRRANGGIDNTREAIDYALARIPEIDPKRLYVAGHSSAAVLALQAAEHDPRIAACAAYAPATDLQTRLGGGLSQLERVEPGITEFLASISPLTGADKLRCPLYLFHADDDANVPLSDNEKFAEVVRKTNPKVDFVRVPTGDHYDSMIQQGIPGAIKWFKSLPH